MCGDADGGSGSGSGSGGVGAAAAGRDAANNANQSSAGVGYGGGYYGGGVSRGDQNGFRDKETGVVEGSLSQDVKANLETVARREAFGYAPTSRSDRRGSAVKSRSGNAGLEGSVRDGILDAAEDEGYGDEAGLVASLTLGPVAGYFTKTAIDAKNRAEIEADVMGATPSYGEAFKDVAIDNLKDGLISTVGSGLGGALGGAVAGQSGAVVGSVTGGKALKGFVNSQPGNPSTSNNSGVDNTGGDGLFASVASDTAPSAASPTHTPDNTGYDSTFGSYDSHVNNFGYSSNTALEAWA